MNDDPIASLEYESLILNRHLSRFIGRVSIPAGTLDQSAYVLLTLLQVQGASTIGELRQITGLDDSTLNRQTKALVQKGYAERIADPEGGVARRFQATAKGKELQTQERQASIKTYAEVLGQWSQEELTTCANILRQLNNAVEEKQGHFWPRP